MSKQVPGLYKIFDEIIVNASDNKQRDPTMDTIKVRYLFGLRGFMDPSLCLSASLWVHVNAVPPITHTHPPPPPNTNAKQVEVDQENNTLSVWNNGSGIPVVVHKEHGVYVPELIFGNLLTGAYVAVGGVFALH